MIERKQASGIRIDETTRVHCALFFHCATKKILTKSPFRLDKVKDLDLCELSREHVRRELSALAPVVFSQRSCGTFKTNDTMYI